MERFFARAVTGGTGVNGSISTRSCRSRRDLANLGEISVKILHGFGLVKYIILTCIFFHLIPANFEIGRSSAGELKPLHKLLYGRDGRVCFRNQYLCLYFILSLFRCVFSYHTCSILN